MQMLDKYVTGFVSKQQSLFESRPEEKKSFIINEKRTI